MRGRTSARLAGRTFGAGRARFGGFVVKYIGYGVLVYFGYPQAHEDDAERSVRAGLEVVAAVGALTTNALPYPRRYRNRPCGGRRPDVLMSHG
jgi:class 3 adenylate cyclase